MGEDEREKKQCERKICLFNFLKDFEGFFVGHNFLFGGAFVSYL
jgi:hypothetical protein